MLREFNLLVTTTRGNEAAVCSEIWYLLGEIGDKESQVDKTGVSGLIAAKTSLSPLDAVERLRKILRERAYEFRYSLRIIPIQRVVQTDLDEIKGVVAQLSKNIGEHESFRVTVEKRFSRLSGKDIIDVAAENVDRKVDLSNPDKIILIEVVGGRTGVSVIKPSRIVSVVKEKIDP